ncbi:hypothetical protein NDU88_000008 [Pleurodeles waltl]|uniref:Uncharacterized protein n=1 Tax=Pleurodeles waltl TaxID=8319 RepID=A0AAV7WE64_PLEWA|nr:hypothetical protein NDU88_000008 [Pleurodeles waltl]
MLYPPFLCCDPAIQPPNSTQDRNRTWFHTAAVDISTALVAPTFENTLASLVGITGDSTLVSLGPLNAHPYRFNGDVKCTSECADPRASAARSLDDQSLGFLWRPAALLAWAATPVIPQILRRCKRVGC